MKNFVFKYFAFFYGKVRGKKKFTYGNSLKKSIEIHFNRWKIFILAFYDKYDANL